MICKDLMLFVKDFACENAKKLIIENDGESTFRCETLKNKNECINSLKDEYYSTISNKNIDKNTGRRA